MQRRDDAHVLVVLGRIVAAEGKEARLAEAFAPLLLATKADPDNLGYVLHVSDDNPHAFMLIEHWRDGKSHAKHKAGSDYRIFLELVNEERLLDNAPEETRWYEVGTTYVA